MNRILIFLAVSTLMITQPVFAQTQEEAPPENGNYKTFYESGALKGKEHYKNGQLHGAVKYYFEDGTLALETKFKNGKINGVEKTYYPNGKLKREASFKDDIMEGFLKLYDAQGSLTNDIKVTNGKREGIAKAFREDTSLKEECEFTNDQPQTCSYFDETGLLKARSQIDPKNPKRTIYLTYDKTGKIIKAQQSFDE